MSEPPSVPDSAASVDDLLGARPCRGCGQLIYWWRTKRGKPSPHDHDGISHFATCPEAQRFRPPKEGRKP